MEFLFMCTKVFTETEKKMIERFFQIYNVDNWGKK